MNRVSLSDEEISTIQYALEVLKIQLEHVPATAFSPEMSADLIRHYKRIEGISNRLSRPLRSV